MVIEEMLVCLRIDGWCVVPDVIPQDQIAPIRKNVEETTYAHGIKTRADGVAACKGLLAFDQSFAPCLADERILGIAAALFGPHVRISFTTTHSTFPVMRAAVGTQIGRSIKIMRAISLRPIPMSSCT